MDAQDQNSREEDKSAEAQEFTSGHDTLPPGLPPEPPPPDNVSVSDQELDIDPDLHQQQLQPIELELVSEEKPEFSDRERRTSEVEPEINNNAIEEDEKSVPAYSKINDDDFATVELDGKFLSVI